MTHHRRNALKVYLCTEGRILAHADVDMSLLLPRQEWEGRNTREFGLTGMEGDFQLRLPGDPSPVSTSRQGQGDNRSGAAAVTIGAELTRADSDPDDLVRSGSGRPVDYPGAVAAGRGRPGKELRVAPNPRTASAGARGVRTWSHFAPSRRRVVITAALQRLELEPASPSGGGSGNEALSSRRAGVLVGITNAPGDPPPSRSVREVGGVGSSTSPDSFRVVDCGERGEVFTEDSHLLESITWTYKGDLPDSGVISVDADGVPGDQREFEALGKIGKATGTGGGARGALAEVRVLAASGAGGVVGDVTIAKGLVPWPSSLAGSGRQHVNVKLVSPAGAEVGGRAASAWP